MKVLVTGTNGYIGVVMGEYLQQWGHEVAGIDTGFYTDGWLYDGVTPIEKTIQKDIRKVEAADLEGFDAVSSSRNSPMTLLENSTRPLPTRSIIKGHYILPDYLNR